MNWLVAAISYAPEGIQKAAWVAKFLKWREEKRAKGELDSQKKEARSA
jgi:hypothetical protein